MLRTREQLQEALDDTEAWLAATVGAVLVAKRSASARGAHA